MIKYLIAFAGPQLPEALLPAFDSRFAITDMVILVPPGRDDAAQCIADIATQCEVTPCFQPIDDDWNVKAIQAAIRLAVGRFPENTAAINLSGTNPIEAAAAAEVAKALRVPAFAVHPDRDEVAWVGIAPEGMQLLNIEDTLTLDGYFQLHGWKIKHAWQRMEAPQVRWDAIADKWLLTSLKNMRAISAMNWLATEAVGLATPIVVEGSPARPLCDFLVQRQAAEWVDSCLRFADEQTRIVTAGGWLEHYVFRETLKLVAQGLIQDTACSIRIDDGSGLGNEFDVAFLANNSLHIIECKGRRPLSNGFGIGVEHLYKLDSLASLGGMPSKAMLVSLARPENMEAARAETEDLHLVAGNDLRKLGQKLEEWVRSYA